MAASFNNLDSVISHFKDMDCPYFLISEDKKNIFYANSTISNIDEAADKLREKLEDKDHTKPFHIYCFNQVKRGGLSIKENGVYFSYQKSRPAEYGEYRQDNRGLYEMLRQQSEQINELRQMIHQKQLETIAGDEEEEIEEQMQPNYMGAIGEILGHPAIAPLVTAFVTNIAANIATSKPQTLPMTTNTTFNAPKALAGTEETGAEELTRCLEILFEKGVTLDHLQKLAAMPTAKIKMLLTML
jgi:hypothetical protein